MPLDGVRDPGFTREAESLAQVGTWLAIPARGGAQLSPEARAILGVREEWIAREDYAERIHPEERAAFLAAHRASLDTGAPLDSEHRLRHGDGWRWIRLRARLVGGRWLGVVQDISAHKRALEELRESDRRLWTIVESSMVGLWSFDADSRTTFVNVRMADLLGYSTDEMIGRSAEDFVPSEQLRAARATFHEQRLFRARQIELTLQHRNGERVHCVFETTTLADPQGYGGFLAVVVDVTARRRTEDALRHSEEHVRLLLDSTGEGICGMDLAGRCIFANRAAVRLLGWERETDLLGRDMHETTHHTRRDGAPFPRADCPFATVRTAGVASDEILWRRDGTSFDAECRAFPVERDGEHVGTVVSFSDVSERRLAEASLRQAVKMEAVGRLAGGVAHDFNNILSVILSYTSLAAETLPAGSPVREDLEEVRIAAERAAELTKQLLAFSRHQVLEPKTLDVAAVAAGMNKMLVRLVGEDIDIAFAPHGEAFVHADRGQIEQIILNLAVNSRDAMPHGGRLEIATAPTALGEERARALDLPSGPYVLLSVTDDGCGMTPAVRARIFEPFFTTKGPASGTGLGLATVYGAVKAAGGAIQVASEPGRGTRFDIFLPRIERTPRVDTPAAAPVSCRGDETILVVEDNAQLRAVTCSVLRAHGYSVIDAATPGDALLVCEQQEGSIDLMLADVVMPRMNGRQLAERVAPLRPQMRVLYTSGYTADDVLNHGIRTERVAFLRKPACPQALLQKLRETLDAPLHPSMHA